MRGDLVRALVLQALGEILDQARRADSAVDRLLRAHRHLASDERAAVARRALGIACLRGRLDFILDAQVPGWRTDPHRHRLLAYVQTEEGIGAPEAALEAGLSKAPLLREPAWPDEPVARLCAERSLPRWLGELWHREYRGEADALARAMNRPGPATLRANALETTREALIANLARESIAALPGAHSPWAAHVQGRANLFGSRLWRAGHFEVQDEGSQLVALLCAARPGEKVVDYCAGLGGKTLALAAEMQNRGELWALDSDAAKLRQLPARLARAGVVNACWALVGDLAASMAASAADCVLVDAPCSSLGTLRRAPDARWRLKPEELAELPGRQLDILRRASALVRRGGRLIYATCTLRAAENRGVIEAFLSTAEGFDPLGEPLEVAPHTHGTDGFFAVALRRRGERLR